MDLQFTYELCIQETDQQIIGGEYSGTSDSHFRRHAQTGRASFSLRPSVESRAVFCNLSNFRLHGLQLPKCPVSMLRVFPKDLMGSLAKALVTV